MFWTVNNFFIICFGFLHIFCSNMWRVPYQYTKVLYQSKLLRSEVQWVNIHHRDLRTYLRCMDEFVVIQYSQQVNSLPNIEVNLRLFDVHSMFQTWNSRLKYSNLKLRCDKNKTNAVHFTLLLIKERRGKKTTFFTNIRWLMWQQK